MRLLPTSKVPDGAVLARDILTGRDAVPLLRAGAQMNDRFRDAITKAGLSAVYVEDAESEGVVLEPLITDQTRLHASRTVSSVWAEARRALSTGEPLGRTVSGALTEVVDHILHDIADTDGSALVLTDLSAADAYPVQHAIDVTALGLAIGQRLFTDRGWLDHRGEQQFDRREERMERLGVGLLLHDIGMLTIAPEVLSRRGPLTDSERRAVRAHPRAGVELIRDSSAWCPLVQAVTLRHHERWDGSGYPDGKAGEDIHEMARIAAVVDVYDAITSQRAYAPARPAHEGVRTILDGAGTQFDPAITDMFARVVAPFPPGEELQLADGRRALVVSVPEAALDRPRVRVFDGPDAPLEIDLLMRPEVRIAGWDTVAEAAAA